MVDAIGRHFPQVSVLATSREGLALAGEQIVAVPSLGVPAVTPVSNSAITGASDPGPRLFAITTRRPARRAVRASA